MRHPRRAAGSLALGLALLVTAACSAGDETGAADESAPAADASTSEESAPAPGASATASEAAEATAPSLEVTRLLAPVSSEEVEEAGDDDLAAWQAAVPGIADVRVTSSADGSEQPSLWLPPAQEGRPLLVVLHSWSSAYQQQLNIPYGTWAAENGWGMVVPNFRGVNEQPEATASDLAVADVNDAVDYALAEGGGDPDRVFLVGFSGGGMMSLVMAGQAPERFAGVAAWVPIYDLAAWYSFKLAEDPQAPYVGQIESSCGGPPLPATPAGEECASRSPSAVLAAARQAGVPVYIAAGLSDDNVPASDAARSFNALAAEADRLDDAAVAALGSASLPAGNAVDPEVATFFGPEQPPVLLARTSGPVTLVVFEGVHEMLYDPGLQWMAGRAG